MLSFTRIGSFALCIGLLFNAGTATLRAQSASTGTISGQVTDPQGAAIPGAEVKLVDNTTATAKTASTNEAGRYNFFNVGPGVYDVTIVSTGFAQTKFAKQNVEVGLVLTLDAVLQIGSAATIVEVPPCGNASAGR